jgi:hypothetical protein
MAYVEYGYSPYAPVVVEEYYEPAVVVDVVDPVYYPPTSNMGYAQGMYIHWIQLCQLPHK